MGATGVGGDLTVGDGGRMIRRSSSIALAAKADMADVEFSAGELPRR